MLWVMYLADRYELPLAVEPTLAQLCRNVGLNLTTVASQRSRGYTIRWKGLAVRIEGVEELEDEKGE